MASDLGLHLMSMSNKTEASIYMVNGLWQIHIDSKWVHNVF